MIERKYFRSRSRAGILCGHSSASLRTASAPIFEFLVVHLHLRKVLLVFVEITDFHQRWPEFQRSMDYADNVVDDPADVLLKEVRLKAVK